jgi:hypothetical protein
MLAGTFAAVELGLLFFELQKTAREIPVMVERQIWAQGDATRKAATDLINSRFSDLQATVTAELANTRDLAASELEKTRVALRRELIDTRSLAASEIAETRKAALSISGSLDKRLALIQGDLNGHVAKIRTDLNAQLTAANGTIANTAEPFQLIGRHAADAAPLFLDCDHNADCLYNRWVGFSRGTERAADGIGKISQDFSVMSRRIVEKKPFYLHLIDAAPGALAVWKVFKGD